ncbi:MAG: thiamine pyrophosphate-dependent enzyme [Halodesulfurarchaeum sp.]
MPWIGTPEDEQLFKGHPACAGCGMALGVRHVLQVAGDETTLVIPASCASVMQGVYPYTPSDIPVVHTAFAAAPSTASGIQMSFERQNVDGNVVVLAGDGATTDIGLASLSGTLERDDDILYILYDNEAYSNTGFQKSGRTPQGARTTTTPTGRIGRQKDIADIVEAHDPAYMATASPAFLNDLRSKTERGLDAKGTSFIHLHSPCPPGWRMDAGDTVDVAKSAVASAIWVLYERERGGTYQINQPSKAAFRNPDGVEEYLEAQGRFSTAKDADVEAMRKQAERNIETFSAYLDREVASQ